MPVPAGSSPANSRSESGAPGPPKIAAVGGGPSDGSASAGRGVNGWRFKGDDGTEDGGVTGGGDGAAERGANGGGAEADGAESGAAVVGSEGVVTASGDGCTGSGGCGGDSGGATGSTGATGCGGATGSTGATGCGGDSGGAGATGCGGASETRAHGNGVGIAEGDEPTDGGTCGGDDGGTCGGDDGGTCGGADGGTCGGDDGAEGSRVGAGTAASVGDGEGLAPATGSWGRSEEPPVSSTGASMGGAGTDTPARTGAKIECGTATGGEAPASGPEGASDSVGTLGNGGAGL